MDHASDETIEEGALNEADTTLEEEKEKVKGKKKLKK